MKMRPADGFPGAFRFVHYTAGSPRTHLPHMPYFACLPLWLRHAEMAIGVLSLLCAVAAAARAGRLPAGFEVLVPSRGASPRLDGLEELTRSPYTSDSPPESNSCHARGLPRWRLRPWSPLHSGSTTSRQSTLKTLHSTCTRCHGHTRMERHGVTRWHGPTHLDMERRGVMAAAASTQGATPRWSGSTWM
jgi:hypothetical protein